MTLRWIRLTIQIALGPSPDPLDFQPQGIYGTPNSNDMSARNHGDMLTGRDGSDMMWSGGFQNVVFNYESSDLPSLRAEALEIILMEVSLMHITQITQQRAPDWD